MSGVAFICPERKRHKHHEDYKRTQESQPEVSADCAVAQYLAYSRYCFGYRVDVLGKDTDYLWHSFCRNKGV